MQYFLGFEEYSQKAPFNQSQLTHFRKRFPADMSNKGNEAIIKNSIKDDDDTSGDSSSSGEVKENNDDLAKNSGTLILDATCTPADIQSPTDLRLLNDARELLEQIVDGLHSTQKGKNKRPRTYREKARKEYIHSAKQRKPKPQQIRKMKGKLLRYIRRLLSFAGKLADRNALAMLKRRQYKNWLVITELCR